MKKTERERAERLAQSAAGAAMEVDVQEEAKNSKTFVPGEGKSAEESFVTSFTPEQKERIRQFVANAKSPAEIEEIEKAVQRGILPKGAEDVAAVNGTNEDDSKKRPAPVDENGDQEAPSKKAKTGEEE